MLLTAKGTDTDGRIVSQPPAAASNGDFTVPANRGQLWQIVPVHITGRALYPFTGFQAPVAGPPNVNSENAGQAILITFSLGGDQGLSVIVPGYPIMTQVDCNSKTPIGSVTETETAGNGRLGYDRLSDSYTYVWKTNKRMAGTCQELTLLLIDGSDHTAYFHFEDQGE